MVRSGERRSELGPNRLAGAEGLVAAGWARTDRIGLLGASNGGLLAAAAVRRRPDLWGAVVCISPLTDMLRYPRFGLGRIWVPEYGDPADPALVRVLRSYSMYHTLRFGTRYPPVLVLTGARDDRVDPLHARKFVAALQYTTASPEAALLRVEPDAGHAGPIDAARAVAADVDVWSFLAVGAARLNR